MATTSFSHSPADFLGAGPSIEIEDVPEKAAAAIEQLIKHPEYGKEIHITLKGILHKIKIDYDRNLIENSINVLVTSNSGVKTRLHYCLFDYHTQWRLRAEDTEKINDFITALALIGDMK